MHRATAWVENSSSNLDYDYLKTKRSLHNVVHPVFSVMFTLSCLLNGGLFLWANLSIGATVWTTVCLTRACPNPTRTAVFDFTLESSTNAMWEAKAYAVCFLIIGGTSVWPYIKMILMLICWFKPVGTGSVQENRRGLVARLLDLLGKVSLIDGFVMILLSVGFQFVIAIILPPFIYITVDVEVTTEWAVTSGIMASAWSALQSHFLLLAHASAAARVKGEEAPLLDGSDEEEGRAGGGPVCFTSDHCCYRLVYFLFTVGVAATALALGAIGATQHDVISYEFGGFAGGLVQEPPPSYTLITLVQSFFKDGTEGTSNQLGIWIVTIGYYMFTLVLHPVQMLACIVHVGTKGRCPKVANVSRAVAALLATWCALDIFLVGCLAAMIELGDLTATVGDKLCVDFAFLVPDGEDCFRSEGKIEPGFFWLAGAVACWMFVNVLAFCSCCAPRRTRADGDGYATKRVAKADISLVGS